MNRRSRLAEFKKANEISKLHYVTSNVTLDDAGDVIVYGSGGFMRLDSAQAQLVYEALRELFEPEPPLPVATGNPE